MSLLTSISLNRPLDPASSQELAWLYRTLRGQIFRTLGPVDLDDHVQDALLTLMQAIRSSKIRKPESLPAFVLGVGRIKALEGITARVHSRKIDSLTSVHWRIPLPGPSPLDLAIESERRTTASAIWRAVAMREREIISRFYFLGQTKEKICEVMGLTGTQFRLLKSRAKAKLMIQMRPVREKMIRRVRA